MLNVHTFRSRALPYLSWACWLNVAISLVGLVAIVSDPPCVPGGELPPAFAVASSASLLLLYSHGVLLLVNRTGFTAMRCVMAGLILALSVGRVENASSRIQRLQWAFSGSVVAKYRSSNHGVPAIRVFHGGRNVAYEGVTEPFWDAVEVGDKIRKQVCSADAALDDRLFAMVKE